MLNKFVKKPEEQIAPVLEVTLRDYLTCYYCGTTSIDNPSFV